MNAQRWECDGVVGVRLAEDTVFISDFNWGSIFVKNVQQELSSSFEEFQSIETRLFCHMRSEIKYALRILLKLQVIEISPSIGLI